MRGVLLEGFDFDYYKSKLVEHGEYYILDLGNKAEITAPLVKHYTDFLESLQGDEGTQKSKYMIKYLANNRIYFDKEYIDSIYVHGNRVSCELDLKNGRFLVGNCQKYSIRFGVLGFTAVMSLSGTVSGENSVLYSSKLSRVSALKDSQLVAFGVTDLDEKVGVVFVKNIKGLAFHSQLKSSRTRGISAVNQKPTNTKNWSRLQITDWFEGTSVNKLVEKQGVV